MYNNRRFRFRKVVMVFIFIIVAISLLSFIVMNLWNAILPAVLHVSAISFPQALGILVLSKILFGGFRGGGWRGRPGRMNKMSEKFASMTPEEREKFKSEWRNRCRTWKSNRWSDKDADTVTEATE